MKENATICEIAGWNQINQENLDFYKAISIDGLSINGLPIINDDSNISDIKNMVDFVESNGLKVYDMRWSIPDWGSITNGRDDKDKQIEMVIKAVKAIGSAGVPFCGYTFMSIGHFRTQSTDGRGKAKYSTFNIDEYNKANTEQDLKISKEALWENIEYFLKKVLPVAEESGIKLALHPDDPPIDIALGGAPRIIISPDNYQKVFDLVPSDSNCMLFCQGCFSEMGVDLEKAIKHFGLSKKICMVHFRNIKGNPLNFIETFIDEGDIDMYETMQFYREVGFDGPFLVDHIPSIPQILASKAYAVGYIRSIIQSVYR
jgi:mannonate dehydratase